MRWALSIVVALIACHRGDDFPVFQPDPPPDAAVSCGLVTCDTQHATCGPIGDGCGNAFDCGACTPPQLCGGDGASFVCGDDHCQRRTCSDAGASCGRVADSCGGLTPSCGTCGGGDVCGGGGIPNVCGHPACTGLCLQQQACGGQPKTTITGKVTAPGHASLVPYGAPDPIYGAAVYVPNGAAGPPTYGVTPFAPGVACDTCSSTVSGTPLVIASTGVDGTFTLPDAPCGTDIPLVIQLNRWRRQIVIPSVACCATTALTADQTHLPRTHVGEPGDVRSDIPLIAVSTGTVDPMHCVLRKMGVADAEFANPGTAGRVQLFHDTGAIIDATTPSAENLWLTPSVLPHYDMVLFECIGDRDPKDAPQQQHVIDFANAGGRVFATHFSYVWLTDSDGTTNSNLGPKPFSQTATWLVDQAQADTATATVDQTLQGDPETQARRIAFASWLSLVGASTVPGQITINAARHDFDAVNPQPATASGTPAQRWLSATSPFVAPLHYTFDTPVSYAARPTKECGRVLFSDFHVSDANTGPAPFPTECADGPMTPQEKTLEFMLFDLTSCIGPPAGPCVPRTCAELGVGCGVSGDGCDDGIVLNCGGCFNGEYCGGGFDGTCGTGPCVPQTCAAVGADCGPIGNGCGGAVDCGTCSGGESCGANGMANKCGIVLL